MDDNLNLDQYLNNLVLISNFIELGSRVVTKIAGNDISSRLDNDDLKNVIRSVIAAKLAQKLAHHDKV